jgi:hypothetical protein
MRTTGLLAALLVLALLAAGCGGETPKDKPAADGGKATPAKPEKPSEGS